MGTAGAARQMQFTLPLPTNRMWEGFAPPVPWLHLTPTLSPTSWRRGGSFIALSECSPFGDLIQQWPVRKDSPGRDGGKEVGRFQKTEFQVPRKSEDEDEKEDEDGSEPGQGKAADHWRGRGLAALIARTPLAD
jgi:hypothetical protein